MSEETVVEETLLHGRDPVTGFPATWHLVPVAAADGTTERYEVEWVIGFITHPAVWMQATKATTVLSPPEAAALRRQVLAA